jgi:hypothetical protein
LSPSINPAKQGKFDISIYKEGTNNINDTSWFFLLSVTNHITCQVKASFFSSKMISSSAGSSFVNRHDTAEE